MEKDDFFYSYYTMRERMQLRLDQSEKYRAAKIFAVLENKERFLLYSAARGAAEREYIEEEENGILIYAKTAERHEEHFIPYRAIQRISAEISA